MLPRPPPRLNNLCPKRKPISRTSQLQGGSPGKLALPRVGRILKGVTRGRQYLGEGAFWRGDSGKGAHCPCLLLKLMSLPVPRTRVSLLSGAGGTVGARGNGGLERICPLQEAVQKRSDPLGPFSSSSPRQVVRKGRGKNCHGGRIGKGK